MAGVLLNDCGGGVTVVEVAECGEDDVTEWVPADSLGEDPADP